MISALLMAAAVASQPASVEGAYAPYLNCYWAHMQAGWQFNPAHDILTTKMLTTASHKCVAERAQGHQVWEDAVRNNPRITDEVRRSIIEGPILGLWSDDMIARLLPSGRAEKFVAYLRRLGKERALRLL